MKIEIHLQGPQTVAWLKNALDGYAAAAEADQEEADRRFYERLDTPAKTRAEAEPAPVEAEKPKRSKKLKVEVTEVADAEEPAAQITTSPEDRKPVEEIEEAEVVTETVDVFEEPAPAKVYTRDDVKDAMQRYVAKHGMDKLAANAATLLGAPKLSAIPEDPAAFKAAVERLEAALA